jgi:hypothetical protein
VILSLRRRETKSPRTKANVVSGPGESNQKQIDGKPYAFNPQTKRWDIVLTVRDPTPPTQPPTTPPNRNDGQEAVSGQLDDAMVAVTEQIGNALWGLRDTLWQA